ncbi:MAG: HEAT repeat domain-containing protein [Aureliella sp.]
MTAQSPAELRDWDPEKLVEQVSSSDLQARRDAVYELVRRRAETDSVIHCLASLADERDEQLQFQALMGLARAGEKSLPVAEELVDVLDDRSDQMRYRAAEALGNMGPGVVSLLVEKWSEANSIQKIGLCNAFVRLGAVAIDAKPILIQSLSDGDPRVVESGVTALAEVALNDAPLWCELASNESSIVRWVAIRSLSAVEEPGEEVRSCLENAIHDSESRVREQALISVARSKISRKLKIEILLKAIEDPEFSVRSAAVAGVKLDPSIHERVLQNLASPLKQCDSREKVETYLRLIESLSIDEPDKAAVSELVSAILERGVRLDLDVGSAAAAIASLGNHGVQHAIKTLSDDERVEPIVSMAIAKAGSGAENLLVSALENNAPVIRIAATRAIGALEPASKSLVPSLIARLDDDDANVRRAAVESLGVVAGEKLGADSKQLIQEISVEIVDCSKDEDESVRASAIRQVVVAKLSPDQEAKLINGGLDDSAVGTRVAALECLVELPTLLQRRADRVFELLVAKESEVRALAFRALGALTGQAEKAEAISRLASGLSDQSMNVRVAATESLSKLEAKDEVLVTLVAGNLGNDLDLLRVSLRGLESAGQAASMHSATVRNLLQHPLVDIRIRAVSALAAVEADKSALADSLTEALEDSEWTVRRAACEELGGIGEDAKVAIPKLFGMIDDEEDESIATGAIRDIGAAPLSSLPLLIEGYESENFRKRLYAVFLTGKIGKPAKEALPKLEEMLEEANRSRRSGTTKKYILQAIDSISGED